MPEACENCLGLVNICIYNARQDPCNLPGTAYSMGFKALKSTE